MMWRHSSLTLKSLSKQCYFLGTHAKCNFISWARVWPKSSLNAAGVNELHSHIFQQCRSFGVGSPILLPHLKYGIISLRLFPIFTSTRGSSDHGGVAKSRHGANYESHNKEKEKVLTVPNVLTVSRLLMSPVLGYLILQQSYLLACGLSVIVALTDVLDGWIARNFKNQASALGSILDPLADKVLVTILFISLTAVHLIPLPLAVLVIGRDMGLIGKSLYVRYASVSPPVTLRKFMDVSNSTVEIKPTVISKLNTGVQLSLVALSLAAPVFGFVDHTALHILWYVTASTTIASGINYMYAKDTYEIKHGRRGS